MNRNNITPTVESGLIAAIAVILGLISTYLPVIGMFSHPAPYCIALLFLILFGINKKSWRALLAMFPLLLSAGIVVAAPVIQEHPRYAFPIIYSMSVILAYYLHNNKTAEKDGFPERAAEKKKDLADGKISKAKHELSKERQDNSTVAVDEE